MPNEEPIPFHLAVWLKIREIIELSNTPYKEASLCLRVVDDVILRVREELRVGEKIIEEEKEKGNGKRLAKGRAKRTEREASDTSPPNNGTR